MLMNENVCKTLMVRWQIVNALTLQGEYNLIKFSTWDQQQQSQKKISLEKLKTIFYHTFPWGLGPNSGHRDEGQRLWLQNLWLQNQECLARPWQAKYIGPFREEGLILAVPFHQVWCPQSWSLGFIGGRLTV